MKSYIKAPVAALLTGLFALPTAILASPEHARIDGNKFKNSADGSLYQWQLVTDGFGRTGDIIEVKFTVSKGVHYGLATGIDTNMANLDATIYAEEWQVIVEDRTPRSRVFVTWCAQYSGTAIVHVHVRSTTSAKEGAYSVWLGSLEMQRVQKLDAATAPGGN